MVFVLNIGESLDWLRTHLNTPAIVTWSVNINASWQLDRVICVLSLQNLYLLEGILILQDKIHATGIERTSIVLKEKA